jgi:N-acetylneuraminic acid mutarotase
MWKSCANLPDALNYGMATVIDDCIYCYFADYNSNLIYSYDPLYLIYCYDPAQDTWTTLPPLPVRWIGLGQINEILVTVGGITWDIQMVNELYTYNKVSRTWEQTFPPMPTARRSPGVLQIQSAFLAVGGVEEGNIFTNTVEILKLDVMQWYRCKAAQIPVGCCYISLVAIGNICYIVGGKYGIRENTTFLNQALYASIDDLLDSTVATSESSSTSHSGTIWKSLPDTPRYVPTATVLAGRLLAIGGGNQPRGGADMKEVYMYSNTTKCWMYISDLPAPRSDTIVVALSATEIFVIGGYNEEKVNTVYKGTLQIEP